MTWWAGAEVRLATVRKAVLATGLSAAAAGPLAGVDPGPIAKGMGRCRGIERVLQRNRANV